MKYFKALVFLLILFLIFAPSSSEPTKKANLARIDLEGAILNSDKFLEEVDNIRNDENIQGVLLVINSPGGAIAPSIEMSDSIKTLAKHKVVISYAQGAMASGSYYAGMWANKIIANRGALVGSIGVIFSGANFEELIAKIGIKPQTIKAGIYKEAGTPTREWSKEEKDMIENLVQKQYEMFVNDVSQARGIDPTLQGQFAQGRVFTANEALELKLIDSVGSIYDAQKELLALTNLQDKEAIWLKKSKMEEFMENLLDNASKGVMHIIKEITLTSQQPIQVSY